MKKISLFCILFLFSFSVFSQEIIEMPDVSTTISGSEQELLEDSLPDFSDILPVEEELLPQLETNLPKVESEQEAKSTQDSSFEDFTYFEGKIGGGFPNLFLGDFALSRSEKNNYFNFEFFHETINGYGLNESSKGFFNNETNLNLDGTINFSKNFNLDFFGEYSIYQFGLQSLSPVFYSTNLQQGNLDLTTNFVCSDSLQLYGKIDTEYSSWFASFIPSSENSNLQADILRFAFAPRLGLSGNAGIFTCYFEGGYDLYTSTGNLDLIVHRGDLLYYMDFRFGDFLLSSDVGLVFVDKKTFVPFSVGLEYSGKVEFSLLGGLKSFSTDVFELEKNPILFDDIKVTEQNMWFANLDFMFPLGNFMENNIKVNFALPAWESKIILPDYSKVDEKTGLYLTSEFSFPILTSEYDLLFYFEKSQLNLSWNAWWLDLPENLGIPPHEFSVQYSFVPAKNNWGFSLWASMNILGNREILGDLIPDTGLSVYIRSEKSFKFTFELDDMVKLFTGTERTLYGNYSQKSGSASIFVSFYL